MTHQVNPIISNLRLSAFIVFLPLFSCSTAQIESASEGWVNQIRIDNLAPSIITRGTKLIINGDGFVGSEIGTSRVILEMQDRLNTSATTTRIAELLTRESRQQVSTILSPSNFDQLCPFSSVDLKGHLSIETVSATSSRVYESARLEINLQCNRELSPILERVPFAAVHLNDPLIVEAAGILLGEQEGESTAVVSGCIKAVGSTGGCDPSMPMLTNEPFSIMLTDKANRRNPALIISPRMTGLNTGFFEGTVHLRNTTAAGSVMDSASMPLNFQVLESTLSSVNVNGTSLGGYLDFTGNGFLGLDPRGLTTVIIDGYFEQSDGTPQDIRTEIVTLFDSPNRVRYVLNEEDSLGQILKLRKNRGWSLRHSPRCSHTAILNDSYQASIAHLKCVPSFRLFTQTFYPVSMMHSNALACLLHRLSSRILSLSAHPIFSKALVSRFENPPHTTLPCIHKLISLVLTPMASA